MEILNAGECEEEVDEAVERRTDVTSQRWKTQVKKHTSISKMSKSSSKINHHRKAQHLLKTVGAGRNSGVAVVLTCEGVALSTSSSRTKKREVITKAMRSHSRVAATSAEEVDLSEAEASVRTFQKNTTQTQKRKRSRRKLKTLTSNLPCEAEDSTPEVAVGAPTDPEASYLGVGVEPTRRSCEVAACAVEVESVLWASTFATVEGVTTSMEAEAPHLTGEVGGGAVTSRCGVRMASDREAVEGLAEVEVDSTILTNINSHLGKTFFYILNPPYETKFNSVFFCSVRATQA